MSNMKNKRAKLWQALIENNYVEGDVPAYDDVESPWYVRILIGFSGWFAAVFMLAFIGTAFEFVINDKLAALVVAGGMILSAYKLLTAKSDSDFMTQFALAVSFAGQALLVYSIDLIHFLSSGNAGNWFLLAVIQSMLAWFMPNSTHRIWSSFAAVIAIIFAFTVWHINFIQAPLIMALVAMIWLHEFKWIQYHKKLKAIGYGITIALLYKGSFGVYSLLLLDSTRYMDSSMQPWIGTLLSGAVLVFVVLEILRRYSIVISGRVSIIAFVSVIILTFLSLKISGITIGVMIILLGFANGNRILTGMGIASLIYFISVYYYSLHTTLLEKSQLLAVFGVVLLLASWFMRYILFKEQGVIADAK